MHSMVSPREDRRLKSHKAADASARLERKRGEDKCRRLYGALKLFTHAALLGAACANAFVIHRLVWPLGSGDIPLVAGCGDETKGSWVFMELLGRPSHRCGLVRVNLALVRAGAVILVGVLMMLECGVQAFLARFRLLSRPLFKLLALTFAALLTASDREPLTAPTWCNLACWLLLVAATARLVADLFYAERIREALRAHRRRHRHEPSAGSRSGQRARDKRRSRRQDRNMEGQSRRADGAVDSLDSLRPGDTTGDTAPTWRDTLVSGLFGGAATTVNDDPGGVDSIGPSLIDAQSVGSDDSVADSVHSYGSLSSFSDGQGQGVGMTVGGGAPPSPVRGVNPNERRGRLWKAHDPEGTLDLSAHALAAQQCYYEEQNSARGLGAGE